MCEPAKQLRYFTLFDLLFELTAVGLTCWGCSWVGSKVHVEVWGAMIGGVIGVLLWVGFRYMQYRFDTRPDNPANGVASARRDDLSAG
jgi:hypothetical protein